MWNMAIIDGDLFGVTVTDDNYKGFPIGWQFIGGAGEKIYRRIFSTDLPRVGVTYPDYDYIGASNQLAIAIFASNGWFYFKLYIQNCS